MNHLWYLVDNVQTHLAVNIKKVKDVKRQVYGIVTNKETKAIGLCT